MKKINLKSTLAMVAVAASCLGAWKAYDTYGSVDNSLMMENIEALSLDGDIGGSGDAPSGSYVTCSGNNDWGTTGIMVGNFTTNDHIDGKIYYKNGKEISYDTVEKYMYEKCFAYYPHSGKETGDNSIFSYSKVKSSEEECEGGAHVSLSGALISLYDLWRNLQ
jgi:hypothetical protein